MLQFIDTFPPMKKLASNGVGTLLRQLRTERKLSQLQVCKRGRLPQGTLSMVESGDSQPTLPTLLKICRGIGISLSELDDRMVQTAGHRK